MKMLWSILTALFLLLTDASGAVGKVYNWYGDVLAGERKAKEKFPVRGGKRVRAFLRWELQQETPGFRMEPQVLFEDASGKVISRVGMGEALPDPVKSDFIDAEVYLTVPGRRARC